MRNTSRPFLSLCVLALGACSAVPPGPIAAPPRSLGPSAQAPAASPAAPAPLPPFAALTSGAPATTFISGLVYDEFNSPLDGVSVRARSLREDLIYDRTFTTIGGVYVFNSVPAGATLEITASKEGYSTRRRMEVPVPIIDNIEVNRFDFGADFRVGFGAREDYGAEYALSDGPEVVSVSPNRNARGVNPSTAFMLRFSEPVDRDTVEENFGIYAARDLSLSVGAALEAIDPADPAAGGDLVWDESDFDISWNEEETEVTFAFKDGRQLLTDSQAGKVPGYFVALSADDGEIRDQNGTSCYQEDGGCFRLTARNSEKVYSFSIVSETTRPALTTAVVLAAESGNPEGDQIEVEFSEPMVFYTEDPGEVRGNITGNALAQDPIAAGNYLVSVNGGVEFPWSDVGSASFDTNDLTQKTVRLLLLDPGTDLWEPGGSVRVRVGAEVVDPAGNSVDPAIDEADDTAS